MYGKFAFVACVRYVRIPFLYSCDHTCAKMPSFVSYTKSRVAIPLHGEDTFLFAMCSEEIPPGDWNWY